MPTLQAQFALMLSLEERFCQVDDFCQRFESQWNKQLLGLCWDLGCGGAIVLAI